MGNFIISCLLTLHMLHVHTNIGLLLVEKNMLTDDGLLWYIVINEIILLKKARY